MVPYDPWEWGIPGATIDDDTVEIDRKEIDKELNKMRQSCQHKWKLYTGLNEVYTYCEVCNVKQTT